MKALALSPGVRVPHRFKLAQMLEAHQVFGHVVTTGALKVHIEA